MDKFKIINVGDLVYCPKSPLAFWSRLGDPDFWYIGVVLNTRGEEDFLIYSSDSLTTINKSHVRGIG